MQADGNSRTGPSFKLRKNLDAVGDSTTAN